MSSDPTSVMHVIGTVLLSATLGPTWLAELARRQDCILIVIVPKQALLGPLRISAETLLPQTHVVSVPKSARQGEDPDSLAMHHLHLGSSSVWLTHDTTLLPPVVRLAAEDSLVLSELNTDLLRQVIKKLTGSAPRSLQAPDHRGLSLTEVATALRFPNTAKQCTERLRQMTLARAQASLAAADPALLAKPITGNDAKKWAAEVVGCFAAIKAGAAPASLLRHTVLVGAPGTGKSSLARVVAARAGVPFLDASVPGFLSAGDGYLSDSVGAMNGFIDRLIATAPAVGVLEEVDAISSRSAQRQHRAYWTNLVDGMLLAMDRLTASGAPVLLVATTNLLEHVDEAAIRPGRLGNHVMVEAATSFADVRDLLLYHIGVQEPGLMVPESSLNLLVREMIGCTPARIADIVRAAQAMAIVAQRPMQLTDLVKASPAIMQDSDEDTETLAATARHEAAHAVVAVHLGRKVVGISLCSDGFALGRTVLSPLRRPFTLADLEAEVLILMAGQAVDRLFGPGLCSGAADDLERTLQLLGQGYARWGFHPMPLSMPGESLTQRIARDGDLAEAINADLARLQEEASRLVSELFEPIGMLAAELLAERHLDADRIGTIVKRSATMAMSGT